MQETILVIDDIADNVLLLQDELEDRGYRVTGAASGAEGLEVAHRERPDLIMLDVMMPELDGFDVLHELRHDSRTLDIPVLMVSALDDQKSIIQGLDAGAQDYVIKPFDLDVVHARVRSALRTKMGLESLRSTNQDLDLDNTRLARSNQRLEAFSTFASHDLKEPLRRLSMFSDLLQEDLGEELPVAAAVDMQQISSAARRMQVLIDDLCELVHSHKASEPLGVVPLEDCLEQAIQLHSTGIAQERIRVIRAALPAAIGDRLLITQLFANLLSNAIKYGKRPGGTLRINWEQQGPDLIVGVADDGPGIAFEHREEVFQPLTRLGDPAAVEGSGIGLAICRQAVAGMGGKIWIEGAQPQGTLVRFSLPRYQERS